MEEENKEEKMEEKKVEAKEAPVERKEVSVRKEPVLDRMRANPWMVSTIVLGILLIGSLIFTGGGVTGSVVADADSVGDKVIDFLNAQVREGEVVLTSIEKEGDFYVVMVDYQGQAIPVMASLSGNYLYTDVVPLDESLLGPGAGATGERVEVDISGSPVKGDLNAPVTIVEISDYQCPFCAKHYSETYGQIVEKYVDKGIVKVVFKDFPLDFHAEAAKAAEAARCYGEQADYFDYHDVLFENQADLSVENFKKWAVDLGADKDAFDICLDSGKYAADVQADMTYAQSLGVSGTPAFFINGLMVSGAQPYENFERIIEEELAALNGEVVE